MADRDSKRYYWLKLEKDFFKRHDIRIIESQPNGKDYIIFYLKLLCESTSHEGYLRFSETIPYNESMLATITNTNIDIVRNAIKIFIELQMMQLLDDGTYYFSQVEKMIGSETGQTIRKREAKLLKKEEGNKGIIYLKVNDTQEIELEKEKELDIEIDKEKEIFKEKENIGTLEHLMVELEEMKGRILTPKESTQVVKIFNDYGYKTALYEIKKNADKDNPIAYTYKCLYNTIQPKNENTSSGSEWWDKLKEEL